MQATTEMVHRKKRGGSGTAILMVFVSLAFIATPFAVPTIVTGASRLMLVGFGIAMLTVAAAVLTITRLYTKTGANEAFVRTGMGGQRPIIDGGAYVIPVVHEVISVSLQTMRLDVDRVGQDALITGDNLRADVSAEFYIKVQKNAEDVIAAATSLGERSGDPNAVKNLVLQKLISALRTVAATRTLAELHAKRDDFAAAVQQIVEKDLKPNGLTLESVTISKLDQTPPSTMRGEDNVFDAQGLRTIAEITNRQKVERNRIEVEAAKEVMKQDVGRDQFLFEQEILRKKAEADKFLSIERARAEATQQSETFKFQQAQLAGLAEVEKTRAIEIAELTKGQALEVATREREIAITHKDQEKAKADSERLLVEKTRESTTLEIEMMRAAQHAERAKAQSVIQEQAEIEKTRLRQQMQADLEAYAAVRQAEAEQEAADKKASARLKLADAERQARSLEAQGEQDVRMVPVNVEREQVGVERARIDVKREDLRNQAEFDSIARELQVELARIAAEKDARIAMANAFGEAMAKANVTVWGDPTTVSRMTEAFFHGQQNGKYFEGLVGATPPELKETAAALLTSLGASGASFAEFLRKEVKKPSET